MKPTNKITIMGWKLPTIPKFGREVKAPLLKKDIIPLQRKWTWLPKHMASKKIVCLGYYWEEVTFFSTGKSELWIRKLYTEKEQFLKKLKN
tara:strand:- start:217 stop:489 length:273 start_codon:yes stop_codon:yes gene_type:complete